MAETISVPALKADYDLAAQWRLIDVRSPSEYATGHIPGALNVPMEQVEKRRADLGRAPIALVCKSGKRASMVAEFLNPCGMHVAVLEGGTDAWKAAGFPVVSNVRARWSLERQTRFGAGLLVLLGVVLSLTIDPRWIFLSGFVGLGLTFAGVTDICLMGMVLGRLPWNRSSQCSLEPL